MKTLIFLCLILLSHLSLADLVNPELVQEDNVVIDLTYAQDISWEEPMFASPKSERDLASKNQEDNSDRTDHVGDFQMQGQLSVLKEIPYSYPTTSFHYLQQLTLKEMEAESKKNKSR